jgi:hypothetical protein
MAEVTLIVAPLAIAEVIGVHAVKVSARKFYACNERLETLFKCGRKVTDNVTLDFVRMVIMIAERNILENAPKKTDQQKV